jgi:hypothetical protein
LYYKLQLTNTEELKMNKLTIMIGLVVASIATPVLAQHHHYQYRHAPSRHHHNNNWVVPAIVGGVGTAIIIDQMNRPREVIVTPPPPLVVECTAWKEIRTTDGRIYTERTCIEQP